MVLWWYGGIMPKFSGKNRGILLPLLQVLGISQAFCFKPSPKPFHCCGKVKGFRGPCTPGYTITTINSRRPVAQLWHARSPPTATRTSARGAGSSRASSMSGITNETKTDAVMDPPDARNNPYPSKSIFLRNDGLWVDCQKAFGSRCSDSQTAIEYDGRVYLEGLSRAQLVAEAKDRGQKSSGSRSALVERLVTREPPGEALG